MFENNGNIHVYGQRVGADDPLESKVFQNFESSVNLVIC